MIRSIALFLLFLLANPVFSQVPAPADVFGFEPGADYKLADYDQMIDYYRQLDAATDRVVLREIGESVLGRPMLQLFISSEANMAELERWRTTSEALARARVGEDEAMRLSREGKAVVWIDGGLHATERAGGQMTPELAYRLATEESPEMQHIRDNVVLLLMPVMNPDGLDIVVDWYRRNLGTPFETTSPPWLYHHYVGHDNNRDWFMNNMPESRAVTDVLYNEWYPQIIYNHHQTSPAWARIFLPPFRDPVNPHIHPGVTTGVNLVGSAMANRFAMEEKPGVISDVVFSMWWNGGMRTVPYFHNMIGILTETGHSTPTPRYYAPDSLPARVAGLSTDGTNIFYPNPWKGGASHFRDAVDYMLTGSMAVLRIAADRRQEWLYNIYKMGRAAIQKGDAGDPYAYVIPKDQRQPREAVNLANILRLGGVEVHRTTAAFSVGDTTYAAGSFVVPAAQAFRPYVMDLLEAQHYPDRRQYPGGPPEVPYDLAGWTLPMQMGVQVDRLDRAFEATAERLMADASVYAGMVAGEAGFGYAFTHQANAAVEAANRLMADGERVFWTGADFNSGETDWPAGTFVVQSGRRTKARLDALAGDLGVSFHAVGTDPGIPMHQARRPKVALYKSWQANMDEGWTRWLLQTYAFDVDTLHDADIRRGDLSKYDAVLLPDQSPRGILTGHMAGTMPAEYTGGLGLAGTAALDRYVRGGGTLVALDEASDFAIEQFGLPVRNVVAGLSPNAFFIPGSLVRIDVDTQHPMAFGMPEEAAASFVRSRAFETIRLDREGEGGREDIAAAPAPPVEVVASYAKEDVLMSGWAAGEDRHLAGKAAMVRVRHGEGDVVLFGFRPQMRGQPRGTYLLLFNALQAATLEDMPAMVSAPGE